MIDTNPGSNTCKSAWESFLVIDLANLPSMTRTESSISLSRAVCSSEKLKEKVLFPSRDAMLMTMIV